MKRFVHGSKLRIIDKRSVHIDPSVRIGNCVTIYGYCFLEGDTEIGDGATIFPGCRIIDGKIGAGTTVDASRIDGAAVGNNCTIGPFARLRRGADIGDEVRIGNFVEIKNASIGSGTKVSHLAYVGDAQVGSGCNIGCGAIFVNYDGTKKQKTVVGNDCFIGSNCNIIAPVSISDGSYVCAGTTVTDDVEADAFVIGRVRQQLKQNRAHEYLKEKEKE